MPLDPMPAKPPVMLTIAGFDPSSGAGISVDQRVFAAHGFFATACITALTVQSTMGVRRVEPVEATLLAEMLDCLADDLPPAGVKIGMLGNEAICEVVADFLLRLHKESAVPIVLDPVLRSSSGASLFEGKALDSLRDRLLPQVTCITPNREEFTLLAGAPIPASDRRALEAEAVKFLATYGCGAVIITGGDAVTPEDLVVPPGVPLHWMEGSHIETTSTHGTGCVFSSALLSNLVRGKAIVEAAEAAKRYVERALRSAPGLGRGRGPLGSPPAPAND